MSSEITALTQAMELHQSGRLDQAAASYRQSIEAYPNQPKAWFMLGLLHKQRGQFNEAIDCYHQVLRLKPDSYEARNNLGNALRSQGRIDEAVMVFQQAVRWQPELASAHYNLGNAFKSQRREAEALESFQTAWRLSPNTELFLSTMIRQMQTECSWEQIEQLAIQLIEFNGDDKPRNASEITTPFSFLCLPVPTTARQQHLCARRWGAARFGGTIEGNSIERSRAELTSSRPIRLGYLSADFREHATAWLIAELFETHDRNRFEVIGYSMGADDQSPIRRRLETGCDRFRDLRRLSYRQAADQIATDGVDILVDLKGYTQDARTEIMACRPAPIAVNYLGYPGTMGVDFIDYILVDDFVVPPDQQPFFTEKLVHLPGCYQVNDSRWQLPSPSLTRSDVGLPEDDFVLCSFNSCNKITPKMFDVWMGLLRTIPASVLWVLEPGSPSAEANLIREAHLRGVEPRRLIFAPRMTRSEHLARHRLADLFLDAYPVNAHTTASDALRMGLPIVTLAGESFVSRVAGSLLRELGLEELIAYDVENYEALVRRLATEPTMLAMLREKLQVGLIRSDLFRGEAFARKVERAYQIMWHRFQSRQVPESFRVEDA